MSLCVLKFLLSLSFFILNFSSATIDVNFFEFQYLADHLSGKECNRLVASLHFHTFELPNEIDAAARLEQAECSPVLERSQKFSNSEPSKGKLDISQFAREFEKLIFLISRSFSEDRDNVWNRGIKYGADERRLPDDVPCIDLLTHWNAAPKEGKGETHVAICHRLNQIGREDLAKWLSRTVSHELSKDLTESLTAGSHSDDTVLNELKTNDEVLEPEIVIDEAAWWELDSLMEVLIGFCLLILLYGSLFWIYLCCSRDSAQCYEKVNAEGILIEEKRLKNEWNGLLEPGPTNENGATDDRGSWIEYNFHLIKNFTCFSMVFLFHEQWGSFKLIKLLGERLKSEDAVHD